MANDKVTVRLETTNLGTADLNDNILLSGPVEIFAVVDNLYSVETDLLGKTIYVSHPTLEEFGDPSFDPETFSPVSLFSPYVTRLVKAETTINKNKSIIIFVRDVRNYPEASYSTEDDQTHRGAYFLLKGFDSNDNAIWQEILLGTHTHPNKAVLDNLTNVLATADQIKTDGMLILVKPDGTFEFEDLPQGVPELPYQIQEKINELKHWESFNLIDSEEHHLDATHEELSNHYDWLDDTNIASGTCRDLYRRLRKADKKLFLNSNLELSESGSTNDVYLGLFVEDVSFVPEDSQEHIQLIRENNKFYMNFPVKEFLGNKDDVFMFDEGNLVSDDYYSLTGVNTDKKELIFEIDKAGFCEKNLHTITVLLTYNSKSKENFKERLLEKFQNEELSLKEINSRLLKLYVQGELARRPNVPHLYLSSDEYGNIHWENKFVPTQTFYKKQIVVTQEMMNEDVVKGHMSFKFEGSYFVPTEDFPILIVDELFAFKDNILINPDGSVEYNLPVNSPDRSYQITVGTVVTLIIVKNSAGKSLADEIADKYITKEDAVNILSHGKLNLSDYVTKNELRNYAQKFHTHSEYAKEKHNHDERYANYFHTHPELYLVMASLLNNGTTAEQIENAVEEMKQPLVDRFESLLSAYDNLDDSSIGLTANLISITNAIIEEYNGYRPEDHVPVVDTSDALTTVLTRIIHIFNNITVTDKDVLISKPIVVNLRNGAVGGIEHNRTYDKGTSLRTILTDILNPYYDLDAVRKILTPTKENTIIHWFIKDAYNDELTEIENISNIHSAGYTGKLYYTIEPRNVNNKECSLTYTDGNDQVQVESAIITVDGAEIENGKYLYGDVDFADRATIAKSLTIRWHSSNDDDIIYDSYGETLPSYNTLNISNSKYNSIDYPIVYEPWVDFSFNLDIPDIYYTVDDGILAPNELRYDSLSSLYIQDKAKYITLHVSPENYRIIFFIEDNLDIEILDDDTNHDILPYFTKQLDEQLENYSIYTFNVMNSDISELSLAIRRK